MTGRTNAGRGSAGTTPSRALERWVEGPWLAYGTLLALQLRVVWGIWERRDLTIGDTASYFTYSWSWYERLANLVCWSPLYTAFYGSLMPFSADAWTVTIAHRLIIVFALALLVLALMRRLLPSALAWLAAAWWVVVPIHFDAVYEVHLFALIPVLLGALAILGADGPRARGRALAILVASSLLMRNELLIATALLAACSLVAEVRAGSGRIAARLAAYALPLAAAAALVLFFYARSDVKFPALSAALSRKHTLNVCQIYAFNYRQRHPGEWNKSEWTECQELMQRDFGAPEPSMGEAIRLNPRAMIAYFAWNVALFPAGLQTVLFDVTSSTINPEYAPLRPVLALVLSGALGALLGAGGVVLWRRRRFFWESWLGERAWGWIYLLAVDCAVVVVMVMQRPRPNYMFALAISIAAAAGMALYVLIPPRRAAALPAVAAAAALLLLVATPTYFNRSQGRVIAGRSRPLLVAYRRLSPYAERFARPGAGFLAPYDAYELCSYLARRQFEACTGVLYDAVAGRPLAAALDEQKVDLVYVDDSFPFSRALASSLQSDAAPWRVVGSGNDDNGTWSLLERPSGPG